MYGYYILVAIVPVSYYIWLKIFSFPLITRKPHELLLILTPEKLKIKKIKSRLYPFFTFKRGLYWFSTPFEDVESNNQFHVYIEGVNQSLGDMEEDGNLRRRLNKIDELTSDTEKINEVTNHGVLLPRNIKGHLHRHYQIILDPISHKLQIFPTEKAQSLNYSFWHTIGFSIQSTIEETAPSEIEMESGGQSKQKLLLTNLTTQVIMSKIKFIQEYKYYSSFSAYTLLRKVRRANTNFVRWVLGSMNPMILLLLIFVLGGIAMVYFGMPLIQPKLGEMPTN
jgi:hypothetical protein